jgi:hypothetical protein
MKKQVREAIKEKLMLEVNDVRGRIYYNKFSMKKLVEEQTKLKRMLPELHQLIRSLE